MKPDPIYTVGNIGIEPSGAAIGIGLIGHEPGRSSDPSGLPGGKGIECPRCGWLVAWLVGGKLCAPCAGWLDADVQRARDERRRERLANLGIRLIHWRADLPDFGGAWAGFVAMVDRVIGDGGG